MGSSPESKPTLPLSPEGRISLVSQFFQSDAFRVAEVHFRDRVAKSWAKSTPDQAAQREELYYMQLGWQAMKQELHKVLTEAEGDQHRADFRDKWDLEQRGGIDRPSALRSVS